MSVEGKSLVNKTTFFQRVQLELKKLFTSVPGWEASASATLTYVAPMVETLVALSEPEALAPVTLLVQKIQSALAAAAVVAKDAGPLPTFATYLNAVTRDLAQIEAAVQVKDASTASKLSATIGSITAEVNAILTVVGESATPVQG